MKEIVAETGRELLYKGLVARTWGNISARTDEEHFAITPSGIDYRTLTGGDMATVDISNGTWEGRYKPSGEWAVHAAAYKTFSNVNFVIHTHQAFASIVGVLGEKAVKFDENERRLIGDIAFAEYGLPGSEEITEAVAKCFNKGSKTVLMVHHGVILCGSNKDEAMSKALALESICKKKLRYTDKGIERALEEGKNIYAVLDDMAQMMGNRLPVVGINAKENKIRRLLDRSGAIIQQGKGLIVRDDDKDEEEALRMLAEKACLCYVNGGRKRLSRRDVRLMHKNYLENYSRLKHLADERV